MKFCIYCGKQLYDAAKFCTGCGAKVYAPESATVTISEVHETKAPETTGKFVISSWDDPKPEPTEEYKP